MLILASPNGFKISQNSFSLALKLHSLNYTRRRCENHSKNFPGKPPKPSKMHPKTPPNWSPRDFQPQALSLNYPHAQNLTFLIEFLLQKRSKLDLKGCWNPLVLALDRHHFESLIFVTTLQRNAHFVFPDLHKIHQNSSSMAIKLHCLNHTLRKCQNLCKKRPRGSQSSPNSCPRDRQIKTQAPSDSFRRLSWILTVIWGYFCLIFHPKLMPKWISKSIQNVS